MSFPYDSRRDRTRGAQYINLQNLPTTALTDVGEDELAAETDEPPDDIRLSRHLPHLGEHEAPEASFVKAMPPKSDQKQSLLTQAILSTPDMLPVDNPNSKPNKASSRNASNASVWSNASLASTAELTSDELTSPARTGTPSPPLPPVQGMQLPAIEHKHMVISSPEIVPGNDEYTGEARLTREVTAIRTLPAEETKVEAGLGRKRCITFACGRRMQKSPENTRASPDRSKHDSNTSASEDGLKPAQPAKRPCMLKFVCPSRESREREPPKADKAVRKSPVRMRSPPPPTSKPRSTPVPRTHRDSESTVKNPSPRSTSTSPVDVRARRLSIASDDALEESEATAFHEFASSVQRDDEWLRESIVHKEKITVNDTLRKENAIRQLAEEAEEEALQEDEEDDELAQEDDDAEEGVDDDEDDDDGDGQYYSDGGNETDDEGGFADSDDESDAGSEYQFWTPGKTTAATSLDALDHIRPSAQRSVSDSSVASTSPADAPRPPRADSGPRLRKKTMPIKMRPGTPDLPDSTDFVPGTLDEDRPLEEAYASCIAQRKTMNQVILPQDIDPSFPTSDPEDEDDDDEDLAGKESDDQLWIKGQLDDFEDGPRKGRRARNTSKRTSPSHSPKRMRSPAPKPRGHAARSPPPRRLLGQSPNRVRSPLPLQRLRPVMDTSSAASSVQQDNGIKITPLPRPAPLTHTKSLPRTPNPLLKRFAGPEGGVTLRNPVMQVPAQDDYSTRPLHTRGAIDIVKGLERKRQRRKEKLYWQKHARQVAKEKERRPQPGKGAERMRELGLEMAGRGKVTGGYWQKEAQYVLSL